MALKDIFQIHFPFYEDVKKKGFGPALLYKVNEGVERFTAGLDIEDIRSMLRGDPAPRPNPRVRPHADGFWFHMRPTYYHNLVSGIYPSFQLGLFSTYFFVFEILTGIFLMVFYTPSPLVAYENMLNILGNVPFGRLMRDMHKLGAELMVIVVCLHMLRTFITGSYKKPRQFTWFTGFILLNVTLFLSFSGYLLPWDQLSLWAVTIGASMIEAVQPQWLGDFLNFIVRGGPQFNDGGLLRWYLAHVLLLPLVGIVFTGVHYYKVVLHGHSLPPEAEPIGEDTAKRVPTDQRTYFMPNVITSELFIYCITTVVVIFWAVFFFHAPLEPHADPLATPLHTTAPWYFLWLQGMLKIGDKVFWGLIAPAIILGTISVIPYFEVGPSRRYGDRRVGLSVLCLLVATTAILSFMGTPRYAVQSSPDQEVAAHLLPQTHPGPVRTANWEELEEGTFAVDKVAVINEGSNETMHELMHEFQANFALEMSKPESLEKYIEPKGELIIAPFKGQDNVKKVTVRITWNGGPEDGNVCSPGAKNEFCQTVFLHEDANYRQGP